MRLFETGVANTLVLATGTGFAVDPLPDSTRLSGPGTTTALYMAVRQARRLSEHWMRRGLPPDSPVDICVDISKPSERRCQTTLSAMATQIAQSGITGCAIVLVTWPETISQCETQNESAVLPGPRLLAGAL